MTAGPASIAPFYADWRDYNRRMVEHIRSMTAEDLALEDGTRHWPIWAIAAHTVGARIFWLCHVLGEPGAEGTPFVDPTGFGWEDDLEVVRSGEEVAGAWESTWRVVEACLERWTPAMLGETFDRAGRTGVQRHSRESILLRLIAHEAYHSGEISLIEGLHGRPQYDPWPPGDWLVDAG
ncbi:MAG TPA: DinB family protein [Candidatus Limnocylindrales bacterium]|nr:DinB family protein [Candidatus Limnocylindrales bacterium]